MPLNGQVNVVVDATEFFTPIVIGSGQPTSGFSPAENNPGLAVNFFGSAPIFEILGIGIFPLVLSAPVSLADGTFSLPTEVFAPFGLNQAWVTVTMSGFQFYRSTVFNLADVRDGLDIFIFQPTLPPSAGVTAGTISSVLQKEGLPGNTELTATPWGLSVQGSESQANIQFGVAMVPDTSSNLNLFLDLAINGWNVSVGWPESWCESAGDIVNSIKSGLQSADSSVNKTIQQQILNVLQGQPLNLPLKQAQSLLANTSMQFVSLSFDNNFTWALSDVKNTTSVLTPNIAIGFPRAW
ncbi:MAG TPA: hypothetical protein VN814_07910 [Caulobacteraceae bacterium]|nr:hypothetical protein [Caulobacteraceae bacterium]